MTQAATLAQLASSGALSANSSGYVGIGTTTPLNTLDVNGVVTVRPTYGTYLVNSYYDGAWKYVGNGVAWGIGDNFGGVSNGVTIANAAVNASGADAALTWIPRLSIDISGNLRFNSGYGSVATAYGCRAWVNFNGVTTITIRGSGNVSSVTRNAVGDYTIAFTNSMPDANYSFNANMMMASNTNPVSINPQLNSQAAGSVRITNQANTNGSASYGNADATYIFVSIFR